MGLGGYLAARTDAEHFATEHAREDLETVTMATQERAEVSTIFSGYGLNGSSLESVVDAIAQDRGKWVDFMMRFELGLEAPDARRAPRSAFTIAISYIVGGIIPLAPYVFVADVGRAPHISTIVMLMALFGFGALKGRMTGTPPFRSGLQSLLIGGIAAGVAFSLARLIAHR